LGSRSVSEIHPESFVSDIDKRIIAGNIAFWNQQFSLDPVMLPPISIAAVKSVTDRLSQFNCRTVLDLGCGYGRMSIALAKRGFDVTAIDFVAASIDWVRKLAAKEDLPISLRVGAAEELSDSAAFDAIYCNSVLDHMTFESARTCLKLIANALRTGGIAFISFDAWETEDPANFETLGDGTRVYISLKRHGMIWRYYTDEEIIGLCRNFKMIESKVDDNGKRCAWLQKPAGDSA
jgi:SAM-dependent methyltransferase